MISKIALLSLLLLSIASNADTASDIKQVVLDNLKYIQAEDIENSMATMHSQSPSYMATEEMLQQLLPIYDLKYEILKYSYIGEDDEYAYAKVLQKTSKISGPAFQTNKLEALQVFKKENGVWKLWTQANLSILFN
ncbi:MAG: hypothetical protein KBT75_04240 [Oleispira antarctica]|uniref:DUF4440 domain-containing protein n=1 Tax=Oleispira antarctica RB-8 TaxID=698738 RepID=R4YMV6_OLEAN|nr:hypothetical protein [Oleispira antarctica]MBQ0792285.1 hypothetical protein [Oleispira antarctica]CCK76336.1 conserved hypothetical protein [Oleispira antarctica RB-8]|tara:strand:- start:319 stop:726 length:408 start_codon:yes stop_codon:yes gene_type:complete